MIVADTNLIAYLLIAGPNSDASRAVLAKDPAWAVPAFWRVEFANVLSNYVKFKRWSLDDAHGLWREACALPFLRVMDVDPGACIAVSVRDGLSLYDALYVELARGLACPFITFDKSCRKAAPQVALLAGEFLGRP